MNNRTKDKIDYGAGDGYPSTGAASGCKELGCKDLLTELGNSR